MISYSHSDLILTYNTDTVCLDYSDCLDYTSSWKILKKKIRNSIILMENNFINSYNIINKQTNTLCFYFNKIQ